MTKNFMPAMRIVQDLDVIMTGSLTASLAAVMATERRTPGVRPIRVNTSDVHTFCEGRLCMEDSPADQAIQMTVPFFHRAGSTKRNAQVSFMEVLLLQTRRS